MLTNAQGEQLRQKQLVYGHAAVTDGFPTQCRPRDSGWRCDSGGLALRSPLQLELAGARRTVSQLGRFAQQRTASLQRDSGWCPARLARDCCCRKVLEPMLAVPIVGVSSVRLEVFESWAGQIRALIISTQAWPISKFWAGLG